MPNPLVSIITPCYRQAHFLRAMIESVLAQTYSPIEIIVVNDGSDDDTETVGRSFGDKVRYYWQPNSGLPAAPRNFGLSQSHGRYVLCVDADDLLDPQAVQWLVDAAGARDDVLCVSGFKRFTNDPALDGYDEHLPVVDGPLGVKLLVGNIGQPNGCLCSRAMLTKIGGFDVSVNLKGCEDWDVWLRLFFAGAQIIPIPRVGAFYRQHPDSLSKNRILMAKAETTVLWRNYRWMRANPGRITELGGELNTTRQGIAKELFDCGYRLRAGGQYLWALRANCRSVRVGGWTVSTVSEIIKLLPHWAFDRFRPLCFPHQVARLK